MLAKHASKHVVQLIELIDLYVLEKIQKHYSSVKCDHTISPTPICMFSLDIGISGLLLLRFFVAFVVK